MSDSSDPKPSSFRQRLSDLDILLKVVGGFIFIGSALGIDRLIQDNWNLLVVALLVIGALLVWWGFFRLWRRTKIIGGGIRHPAATSLLP